MNTKDIKLDPDKIPWRGMSVNAELAMQPMMGDLLCTIFAGQQSLHDEYIEIERRNGCVVVEPDDFGEIDDRQVQMRLKDLMERTIEELMEAANCLKNKPWKQSFVATDRDHFEEEVADALHFFVEMCMTAGITPEHLFSLYFRKHAVNEFRQRSQY